MISLIKSLRTYPRLVFGLSFSRFITSSKPPKDQLMNEILNGLSSIDSYENFLKQYESKITSKHLNNFLQDAIENYYNIQDKEDENKLLKEIKTGFNKLYGDKLAMESTTNIAVCTQIALLMLPKSQDMLEKLENDLAERIHELNGNEIGNLIKSHGRAAVIPKKIFDAIKNRIINNKKEIEFHKNDIFNILEALVLLDYIDNEIMNFVMNKLTVLSTKMNYLEITRTLIMMLNIKKFYIENNHSPEEWRYSIQIKFYLNTMLSMCKFDL